MARRFVPGSFQRHAVEIDEEIEGQEEYLNMWEQRNKDAIQKLDELMSNPEISDEEEWTDAIEKQEDRVKDTANVVQQSREELKELRKLKNKISTQSERMPIMLTMVNTNFAETFDRYVCSSTYTDIVFDIEFQEDKDEYTYNEGGLLVCPNPKVRTPRKPIFLKVEEPGHMMGVLIFPESKVCEIWNTAKVPKNIQKYFVALLPHYYTIICINAQLQIKWCNMEEENVYIVKQKGTNRKPLINIYCQAWPYFFAYMRCVKKYSHLDILKFLSCLTDEQKTILIDTFNTSLANRGKDVQYIREINDVKHFQQYVIECSELLDMQKSIEYVSASSFDDSNISEIKKQIATDKYAIAFRSTL